MTSWRSRRALQGFSLIEISIVLVLIALLVTMAIPTLRSITGAELRSSANTMRGLVREVYTRTALSGVPHRIVFDLDHQSYWVESKKPPESIKKELAEFKRIAGSLGAKHTLAKSIRFLEVSTDAMAIPAKSDTAMLNFFPGGYMDDGYVAIADRGENPMILSLVMEPLTGEPVITQGLPKGKK